MYLGYIDFVIAQGGESDSFVVFFFFFFFSFFFFFFSFFFFSLFVYFHWHSTRLYNTRRPSRPEGVSRCIVDSRKANLHPHAHTHSSHHRCRRRRRSCRRHRRRLFSPLSFSFFLFSLENSRRSERKMTGSETCSFPVYSISFSSTTTTSFLSLSLSPFILLDSFLYACVCVCLRWRQVCVARWKAISWQLDARVCFARVRTTKIDLYIFSSKTQQRS